MELEVISANNVDALARLALELWPDSSFDEELENVKSILGSDNETGYLVKDQEHYIAFVHLSLRHDYVEGATDSPVAYIEGIYVQPEYQKQGIAKTLLTVAEDWARQKGVKQMASDTDIRNATSIEFHKKLGFMEVERIVCFIKEL